MNRAQEKSQRLLQIEKLLWAHPEGLTRAEIARRLGVNRSTITRYLEKGHLPPSIYEDEFDGNKLKIDRSADLTKASFNLNEVLALHLSTRLLATRMDKQNPHAASALRKLGIALQRLDKNVSRHMLRSADVMDEAAKYRDPVYLDVLETLTAAWSAGRKVAVSHLMADGRVFEYTFSPYFIEPYAVGQTTHVIGFREPPGAVRTFKIERLKAARTKDRAPALFNIEAQTAMEAAVALVALASQGAPGALATVPLVGRQQVVGLLRLEGRRASETPLGKAFHLLRDHTPGELLEAKTAALNLLLSEFVEAERERLRLVQQIVEEYELPERRQTLSDVIALAPEPWKSRMQDFQERMQKTLRETRSEVLSNDRIMRGSLTIVDEALASLVSCVPESLGNYDARGAEAQQHRLDPAMIDQRG